MGTAFAGMSSPIWAARAELCCWSLRFRAVRRRPQGHLSPAEVAQKPSAVSRAALRHLRPLYQSMTPAWEAKLSEASLRSDCLVLIELGGRWARSRSISVLKRAFGSANCVSGFDERRRLPQIDRDCTGGQRIVLHRQLAILNRREDDDALEFESCET
jgi:hypothetical protein